MDEVSVTVVGSGVEEGCRLSGERSEVGQGVGGVRVMVVGCGCGCGWGGERGRP